MIGGLLPCSFIDYSGELSAVIFTQGCNLRCRYCHNPKLCAGTGETEISLEEIDHFLSSRTGRLTAVTISGGEPTLHPDLTVLIQIARSYGFSVKLDTNGMKPDIVRQLVSAGLVDYVAVDIKTAPGTDSTWLTGASDQGSMALETLAIVTSSEIGCEARSTVLRHHHDALQLTHMARCLTSVGVKTWRLQPVETGELLDSSVSMLPLDPAILSGVLQTARDLGLDAAVRTGRMSAQKAPSRQHVAGY